MGNSASANKDSVGGKCLFPIPGPLKTRILWCIGETERLKGSPGTLGEIISVFQFEYTAWLNHGYFIAFLQNMFREDTFYANDNFEFYSLTKEHGEERYETFSEKFRRLYPGF